MTELHYNYTLFLTTLLLIVLIGFFCYSSYKEKNLAYDEDANQKSKKSKKSTESNKSQESDESTESNESEESTESKQSEDSTESNQSEESTESKQSKEDIPYIRPYPINGFDINLKSINGFSIEEESSWVWNLVVAKIVCEFIEILNGTREIIPYAMIFYFYDGRLLPARRIVSCKVSNHLRDTTIRSSDIVLLEFNETNKSYKIFRIIHANDSI